MATEKSIKIVFIKILSYKFRLSHKKRKISLETRAEPTVSSS